MKKISVIFSLILLMAGLFACSNTKTYSDLQDEEQALIKAYINRNNITIVTTMPKRGQWKANQYYKSSTGLYFHLENVGDTINKADTVRTKFNISYRFKLYTLSLPSDTLSNWSTTDFAYPSVLVYGTSTSGSAGLQEAVSYMKFNNSQAKIIVPHIISTSTYLQSVTPMGYDIKITGIN